LDAATLNTTRLSGGPIRVRCDAILCSDFAIIARVTVHDTAEHAQLLCTLDLEASEDAAVLGQRNLSSQADVRCLQLFEVPVCAVVYEDVRGRDIAGRTVAMESRDARCELA
jgi:hypothetical protein